MALASDSQSEASTRINWSTVIPWVIAITGLAVSAFQYLESQESRDPQLVTDPSRTEIISVERLSEAPIQVVKQDGTRITDDVTAVNFYFWNGGDIPIQREEVLRPVTITLEDQDAEILDYRLRQYSRDVIEPSITANSASSSTLILSFEILEHNDGMAGQIIYQGDPDADLTYTGVVQGVGSLKGEPTYPLRYKVSQYLDYLTQGQDDSAQLGRVSFVIGVLLPFMIITMIYIRYMRLKIVDKEAEESPGTVDSQAQETDQSGQEEASSDDSGVSPRLVALAILGTLIIIVVVGGVIVPWKDSRQYREANVMNMVPATIRTTSR